MQVSFALLSNLHGRRHGHRRVVGVLVALRQQLPRAQPPAAQNHLGQRVRALVLRALRLARRWRRVTHALLLARAPARPPRALLERRLRRRLPLLAAGVRRLLALLLRPPLLRLGGRERAAARRCLQLCHHSHGCACTHARARSGPRVQRPARVG